jgi:hypothetical protein
LFGTIPEETAETSACSQSQKGMVDKSAIEKELPAEMELFVDESGEFFTEYMTNINPA